MAGIKNQDITIVFAMGIHRNHSEPEKQRLVGSEVYQRDVYKRQGCQPGKLQHAELPTGFVGIEVESGNER